MKVSVIIPCRNEERHIKACIETVLASDYGKENIEVIVVDGMSDDSSRAIIKDLAIKNPNVKLVDNAGQITPLAFNLGIKNSSGDYIVIVGSRLLIDKNYISTCVQILNSNAQIGCIGGRLENAFENKTSRIIATAMASSFGVGGGNFRNKEKDGFTDTVATPVYRRTIFDELGLFDEELVRNQDDEFNFRLLKKGCKIYFTTKTGMRYFVRANYKNLFRQYFQYGYWKVYVNRKHHAITTWRQVVPALFVLFVIIGIVLSVMNKYIGLVYLAIMTLYLTMAFIVAFSKADEKKDTLKIVFSFLILHWGYGSGYLKGIWHFMILQRKKGSSQNRQLSR